MNSLYYVLTDQHREEFVPVRCNQQTVLRLVRSFEDVVTENKLSALVMEGGCLTGDPLRESLRLDKLAAVSRRMYQFSCNSECESRTFEPKNSFKLTSLEESDYHAIETGPFILVLEPRFCGLLASCVLTDERNNQGTVYEMVWTFDPNVVFTGIEYLISRLSVQRPEERARLESLLSVCTPRSSSLKLALTFTTKLTVVMQRQNELEMATNRISSAISSTLELENILQSAVEEVGSALNARRAALVLWQEGKSIPEGMSIYERPEDSPYDNRNGRSQAAHCDILATADASATASPAADPGQADLGATTTSEETEERWSTPRPLEVPISYRDSVIGVMMVEDDTPYRNWEDEEILMVKTVSDQLSVAISHARLFRQVQTQAMTDALTGLYNHRYFQDRLDRETRLADRNDDSVSLILLDLDHLKRINDSHGHRAGDAALRHVAALMKSGVRDVDICARYGGEEFVLILPQCDREGAMDAAERLRGSIASAPVKGVGQITASFGVATYPSGAKSKEELVEMADRAMYLAKAAGRNRVRTLAHRSYTNIDAK
ncbi:MAG TPA: sensor domain-containing diguanylate cyclase [Blastocatellia bacterium]|nr:sensor domain-containing diguanylate cyclase [Blastocatellia bacterium]